MAGLLFGALFFGTVTGLLYVTTLHLQQRLGLPPFEAALMTAPVSAGIAITSFSVRRQVVEKGPAGGDHGRGPAQPRRRAPLIRILRRKVSL
ncbi:hypothetical protein GCM10023322_11880 [Rugosimonospora acidiphila]|uniref:Uncharacterized protein n=1 Tax=Rugosimonospora acidiphila TaxID=556531 RepID=A0ABP9RN85_9ACTN